MLNFVISLSRREKRSIFLILDLVLVPLALMFAYGMQYGRHTMLDRFWENIPHAVLVMMVAGCLSLVMGIPRIKLKAFDRSAVAKFGALSLLACVASFAFDQLANLDLKTSFHVSFALALFMTCSGIRMLLLEVLLRMYRSDAEHCSVLIYGAGRTGMQLASALKSDPSIVPMGFFDDNLALVGQIVAGLPVFPGIQLNQIIENMKPDRVVIAMPSADRAKVARLERHLAEANVDVQVVPSFAQLIGTDDSQDALKKALPGAFLGRAKLDKQIELGGEQYVDRAIMITGAGGSIGSELTRQVILCKPSKIVLFELSELALYKMDMELRDTIHNSEIDIVPILGSVNDAPLVRSVLDRHSVDVILHAAAYKHVPLVEENSVQGLSNNVFGTLTLASAAHDLGVKRFVLVSSDKAVRPANIMGASKRFAEIIVQDLASRTTGTVFSIVRFGNVLGSSGSVIPLFQEQVARGGPVTVTHDDVTRYFMTVQEASQLVLTAGSLAGGGEVFVLDMGKPIRVRKLAEQVIESAGYTIKSDTNPDGDIEIHTVGLRPGEKLHEELLIGDGRMTTRHEKIFSVQEKTLSELEVASAIKSLRDAVATNDEYLARDVVIRWIQGFTGKQRKSL
ncbi:MAG: nucleoside-diphosphate sugar epimerase/dehydratase [Litoreibacter sp.]